MSKSCGRAAAWGGVLRFRSGLIQPKDRMMQHMKAYLRILAALMLVAGAGPALAQVYQYQYQYPAVRPVQWFIDGGASLTQGHTADDFDNGWTIGTGVIFRNPGQPLALRIDVNYARSEATDQFISLNEAATGTPIDHGSLQTLTGFVDGVLEAPVSPWMRLYATGGVGLGYRRIELTQGGFFCDPFFCGPGFGRNYLVASSDTTHFAWNAGAGMDFALPNGQSWFIEARYERIESQGPTEFVPIRFGFRF
jgi:opacity protein-like surface antigen